MHAQKDIFVLNNQFFADFILKKMYYMFFLNPIKVLLFKC